MNIRWNPGRHSNFLV